MKIAIRKFMQITFNAVSNPIFDGVHLIHHIHSTKSTGHSCSKCKTLTEVKQTTGFNVPILPKITNLYSYTNVWFF